ncbi:SGNH/GDSL hydrolase family protein [Oscillatoria sp. FACHB-1406]|uniref:SGNH/GDSL hydrolase family protein n=1 Tax=Oscillatoria sp. FACHB-1406 TaxID=2692846 RepID=UPI001686D920|nr:SGNH/GDSL hydrolase family protein [Oscillatoria sp. FACHB-1406]MBD2578422.1 SGNH/GDSL hydrolase family protein [Oscillatoria sp. FACHB-1406]
MFKFHRNSFKSSYRSSYYGKRKRNSPPLWMVLAAIPPSLILLEILTRLALGVSGQGRETASYKGEPAIQSAYALKFLDRNKHPYAGLSDSGALLAQASPYTGYELAKNQKNQLWQIDDQGFRNDKPIPLAKPKGEVRIFILGNSTAFGQGSPNNAATIASKLEARLQERVSQQQQSPEKYRPDSLSFYKPERVKMLALPPKVRPGSYRVINAAVPGYTSGNYLAQLALEILPYKPDAIIVLGGYTDLVLPSNEIATTIPKLEEYLSDPSAHYWDAFGQGWQKFLSNFALYRVVRGLTQKPDLPLAEKTFGVLERDKSLENHLAENEAELERRVQRYSDNSKQLLQLCTAAGVPLLLALQPEISGRSPEAMSETEKAVLNKLGEDYLKRSQKGYAELAKVHDTLKKAFPNNLYIYNFYKLDKPAAEQSFFDPIHLTEAANTELAKRLYDGVTKIPKMQVTPENLNPK